MRVSVEEIRLGAIYRLAVRNGLGRAETESLMVERLNMKPDSAALLSGHWYTTADLRKWKTG